MGIGQKIGIIKLCLVATLGFSGQAQAKFYDLYQGMLEKQGTELVLKKCALVSADFILEFENKQLIDKLPDLTDNPKVQLHVRAEAREEQGQYYLKVHDISKIAVGSSCNLF